jgi:hypothetical protein
VSAPKRPCAADDAVTLDTSDLGKDAAIAAAIALVEAKADKGFATPLA